MQPQTEPGPLELRFDLQYSRGKQRESIVSWHESFDGPDIFINDPGGKIRLANEADFKKRIFTASNTGESEGDSSVISVHDLGFSIAPAAWPSHFHQLNANAESFMTVENFPCHLESFEGSASRFIGDKMEERSENSKQDGEHYLPLDAFEAIFSFETIESLIKEICPKSTKSKQQEIVTNIIGSEPNQGFRRILATLVLVSEVSYIDGFIGEGIRDYDLPIRRSDGDSGIRAFQTRDDFWCFGGLSSYS